MVKLSETRNELKVIDDQHGIPTSCVDLSAAISEVIDHIEDREYEGQIFHFSNTIDDDLNGMDAKNQKPKTKNSITWADFSREIFHVLRKDIHIENCSTEEYPLKAKRPACSVLKNTSSIILPDWKIGLKRYLEQK